jgi:dTDP-4-dehydrorhamnose reductase
MRQSLENPADASRRGVFHYCDDTMVTWYDFASMIFTLAAELNLLHEIPRLKSIKSRDYPQVARRPAYSVLDTTAIRRAFGIEPPGLGASLRACLEEIQA